MKKLVGASAVLVAVLAISKPATGYAQDFFRDLGTSRSSGGYGPVVPSDYSYEEGSPSGLRQLTPGQELALPDEMQDDQRYNFALGNFRFGLAAGVGIEWNDNIRLSQNNRESDFVFRPIINIDATWKMSDLNTLRFSLGLSYAKYFNHSDLDSDGPLISPTSDISYTFFVSSVKFTIRDRLSYQEDTYDIPEVSGIAKYARWENQAGIQMDWAVSQTINLSLGYDHYNLWTRDDQPGDEFSLQDRSIDTVFVKPSVQVSPAITLGLNGSFSWIDFKEQDRADGTDLLIGPFIEWQISEFTNMYLEGGFQNLRFDGTSNFNNSAIDQLGLSATDAASVRQVLGDNEDSNNFYVKFEINNRPSDSFRHRLSYSHTSEIGFASDFYKIDHLEYNADWKVIQHTEIGPSVFYEHYTTSGPLDEKADRVGGALGIRYHFNNSLTVGLDYRYIWKNSNIEGADYYQNLIFASLYYKF